MASQHAHSAVARAWRRARRDAFCWAAEAWSTRYATSWDTPWQGFVAGILERVVLPITAPLVPPATRLAWFRQHYGALFARSYQGLPWPPTVRVPAAQGPTTVIQSPTWPPTVRVPTGGDPMTTLQVALGSRLPSHYLVDALKALRDTHRYPDGVFRRALTRLARTADGQVGVAASEFWRYEPTAYGNHSQFLLGVELAHWAVTRAAWRRDPSLRRLVTSPEFATGGVHFNGSPALNVLDVAMGPVASSDPRERALALVDALTWPEFLVDSPLVHHLVAGVVTDGGIPSEVLQALTPDDVGYLLASPSAEVRAWALLTALPATRPTAMGRRPFDPAAEACDTETLTWDEMAARGNANASQVRFHRPMSPGQ